MNHKPGTAAPVTGIYWCTVCKTPAQFTEGEKLPECPNFCGRGMWVAGGGAGVGAGRGSFRWRCRNWGGTRRVSFLCLCVFHTPDYLN